MTRRRPTVELQAIIMREKVFASPPPAPAGTSLREWFAGLALGNSEIMRDVEPASRIMEALRVADELIKALGQARLPSKESMEPPTEEQMQKWDEAIAEAKETKERQTRATMPELRAKRPNRTKTLAGVAVDPNVKPTPALGTVNRSTNYQMLPRAGSIPPPKPLAAREEGMGRYQVLNAGSEASATRPPRKTR